MNSNNVSMNMNSSWTTEVSGTSTSVWSPFDEARFWAYTFSDALSLICTLFTLFFLLTDKTLRRALHNHVIIVLLVIGLIFEVTHVPWTLYNTYNGIPISTSNVFYQFWTYIHQLSFALQIELFAWATIERHILIFHDQWVATSKKRFFVHYVPIYAIIIYYVIYYTILFYVPFCTNVYDGFLLSGIFVPCVFNRTVLGVWDLIFHQVVPTLTIVFFSIGLLVRSILQKNRLRQGVNWRKHRKMIIQLLSISSVYVLFNVPWVFTIFAYQYGLPANIAGVALIYTGFLLNYVIFLFPFVACFSLPELRKKFNRIVLCHRVARQVAPSVVTTARRIARGMN